MSSRVVVDRDFNTKTLDKGLKNVEVGIVGKKSLGRINWPIYAEDQDKGPCLL